MEINQELPLGTLALRSADAALSPLDGQPTATELEAQVANAVQAIRLIATPTATWTAYAKALRYIGAWMQLRTGLALTLPVSVAHIQLFILDHFGHAERVTLPSGEMQLLLQQRMPAEIDAALVAAGYKAESGLHRMTTIDHRLSVLSWAHGEKGLESPCQDPGVRRLLADCRKIAKELGQAPHTKTAATQNGLDVMLATCDDSLEGRRDRALLLFGWSSGGRRRSEIAAAEVRDLEWMGADTAIFRMRRSKTGDSGPKPVKDEAAIALREWLAAAKITDGALFRRLWGPKVGERLSAHAIAAIVKRRAAQAGLPGDFAGHSLRRGFVTEAGLNDIPLAQTMAMTGHRLTKSVVRYSEVGDVLSSKASDLLKLGRKRK
ncbi:integrase [Stagnimonas aquatica]|uniref:Integrase n=1 Tax=Stagnimonas aquatica TaxID=2689987 RepID=A0A3N0UYU7_9GAMM|nr:site-specific integrase [Stagnimonas aquatica]ROH85653.1 integrase [Stagnimonas aquatica]